MPRAMLVYAHPDDETVALGARMGRLREEHLVHVTDGAPRNEQDSRAYNFSSLSEYRRARAAELEQMLALAGVAQMSRECLGIPDQEASHNLQALTRSVTELLSRDQPEVVFTHPYEGGHPDHDACAFAVHCAVRLLTGKPHAGPLVIESPFYHAGPRGIATGAFLPQTQSEHEMVFALSAEERKRKQALFACFVTQREMLVYFPDAWERFRVAPRYDFTKPPHEGTLFYEGFPWGITSQRFCELAKEAESELLPEAGRLWQ